MAQDVNNLCRICLRTSDILPSDGLPQQICQHCKEQLKVAYDLRALSLSSDSTLRKYIHQTKAAVTLDLKEDSPQSSHKKHSDIACNDEGITQRLESTTPEVGQKVNGAKKCRKRRMSSLPESTNNFTCIVCEKKFIYMCQLRDHLVSHTGDKPYLCSICGKSFGHHPTLSNHMKLHFGDKKHKCDTCSLCFHRKSHLTLHMRTHTGEKPFVCPHCDRTFAQSSYLKEHMRLHSGEKPFVCETCGRGFARKSCLIMHRRTHTGELPYTCPACGRSFSQRSQRKRHILRNHKGAVLFRENGKLTLRDHDQLQAALSKLKTKTDMTTETEPNTTYQSAVEGISSNSSHEILSTI